MCGRYVIINGERVFTTWGNTLRYIMHGEKAFGNTPRYNASPMQKLPVIAMRDGKLISQDMQWWLVPHWSPDGKPAASTFNARAENLLKSKMFRPYFIGSRCLVPADAFYEWRRSTAVKESKGKQRTVEEKQPMCIMMKDEKPFMFAGLFSVWKNPLGVELPTFTIITTEPNALMKPIHDRMPVILPPEHCEGWLHRQNKNAEELLRLLKPFDAAKMKAYRVSTYVSNSRNEGEECMKPNPGEE